MGSFSSGWFRGDIAKPRRLGDIVESTVSPLVFDPFRDDAAFSVDESLPDVVLVLECTLYKTELVEDA
jgi:hypothetical protein